MSFNITNKQLPHKFIIVVLICLAILAALAIVLALPRFLSKGIHAPSNVPSAQDESAVVLDDQSADNSDSLSGELFFSLSTISTSTGMRNLIPILYHVASSTSVGMLITQLQSNEAKTFQYSISADGNWATFLALIKPEGAINAQNVESWFIARANLQGDEDYLSVLGAVESSSTVFTPDQEDYFRESPVVNNEGSVLYFSLDAKTFKAKKDSLADVSADTWSIYYLDQQGKRSLLTSGLRPKWIDSTHFAYLKKDGVYVFDLEKKTEELILNTQKTQNISDGLDVSDDGETLVMTSVADGTMTILPLRSWMAGDRTESNSVKVVATNPVFSPDGTYVAVVVPASANEHATTTPARSKLRYYSLSSNQFSSSENEFDSKTIEGVYLTDWRDEPRFEYWPFMP